MLVTSPDLGRELAAALGAAGLCHRQTGRLPRVIIGREPGEPRGAVASVDGRQA